MPLLLKELNYFILFTMFLLKAAKFPSFKPTFISNKLILCLKQRSTAVFTIENLLKLAIT